MELNQLEYFMVAARHEHITRASEELHISQPALSRALSRLEESVGSQLFSREGNRVRLNLFGRTFLKRVEQALMQLNDGVLEIQDLNSYERGNICFATSMAGFISVPLNAYLKEHPNIHMTQHIQSPVQMEIGLNNGDIDFALSFTPIRSESIEWIPRVKEEILVYVSSDHPLSNKGTISLEEIVRDRIIFNNNNIGIKETICSYYHKLGFAPDIFYEGNEDEAIISLVDQNLAIVFVPATTYYWKIAEFPRPMKPPLSVLHIADPIGYRIIGTATLRGHYLTKASQHFYNYLIDYFKIMNQELVQIP